MLGAGPSYEAIGCFLVLLFIAVVALDYAAVYGAELIWRTIMRLWRRPRLPRKR